MLKDAFACEDSERVLKAVRLDESANNERLGRRTSVDVLRKLKEAVEVNVEVRLTLNRCVDRSRKKPLRVTSRSG